MNSSNHDTARPPTPKLVVDRVSKAFQAGRRHVQALQEIHLTVSDGEFVCVVGPSGCGKTTLLNLMSGLETPDTGQVLLNSTPVTGPGQDRMVLFQEPSLFPWLTAIGNVLFGLKLKKNLSRREREEVAHFYLRLVGLEEIARANIHELSGGMKQRVVLARALAPNPDVLLMDEPFGALDALTREHLYEDLQAIWQKRRKTIIFVTHNVREAVCLGDRVLLLSASPGQIRQEFEVKLRRPRDINSVELAGRAFEITVALKGALAAGKAEVVE